MDRLGKFTAEVTGWVILLFVLLGGIFIYYIPDFNTTFLIGQLLVLAIVVYYSYRFSFVQITASRVLMGLLFIFSGFVKGVDPVGFHYKIEDYFIAFGTEWAKPFTMILSVVLNATEFILGVLLLFNVCGRITLWLVMAMMTFFTALTLNDAINNPVPDCGCFGDAIKLTNWQTFYKNITIDSLLLLVFLSRKRIRSWFSLAAEWIISVAAIACFLAFEVYNIRHLPVIDFSDWKAGQNMISPAKQPFKYYLLFRNKGTGEEKEYLSPDYPFNDSLWLSQWEFISQRVEDPNPRMHNIVILDENMSDYTQSVIENPEFQFILISSDVSLTNQKGMDRGVKLWNECKNRQIDFILLSASLPDEIDQFRKVSGFDGDAYSADDTELKTMIRSNPGLILMKNGTILAKWHYNDFPSWDELKHRFGF